MLDNGRTVEVTRCTTDGTPNACSLLYSATWRAAKARGYLAATTMTDADEPGASLRGAGWAVIAEVAANAGWDRSHINGRKRANTNNPARLRWAAPGSDFTSPPEPIYPTPPLIDADSLPLELA